MSWVLVDYGDVLSLPRPAEEVRALAELAGLPESDFRRRYWQYRSEYDRADLDPRSYWQLVLGRDVTEEELDALLTADLSSWSHLNSASIAAITRLAEKGIRLALLSNAPYPIARVLERSSALAPFRDHFFFGCDLRLVKPEPAIFHAVLAALGAQPEEVTFVDDRRENIEAGLAVGLTAVQFRDPGQLDDLTV